MAYILKSRREIDIMRQAGRIVHDVLERLGEIAAPGVETAALNAEAERMAKEAGAECLFKGVPGPKGPFPAAICCSINEQVVHGIPSSRKIEAGDLVSIDFGVKYKGYCGDAANTFIIGEVDAKRELLVQTARDMLDIAVDMAAPGKKWSDIAAEMEKIPAGRGFGVVKDFVGHGIGSEMHEDPKVPNYASRSLRANDIILREGLVLAIEPMVNMGTAKVFVESDGWTVVTADGKPSVHYEHSVAITADGAERLTGPQ